MTTERVHTLVLGAGPSGLAAAWTLAKAGFEPLVLEKDKVSGGLMRSIRHGEFILDIGRKELYNRLERVDTFWSGLLGNDYRSYPHRGGLLFEGSIIDMSPAYQGARRGMPWRMLLSSGFDFLWWRLRPGQRSPKTLEEYWYQQRGRLLTQITNQGFQEKLVGRKWADIPMPSEVAKSGGESLLRTLKHALTRTFSARETNTFKGVWKHPAKGTGQICESMERDIVQAGGRVRHGAQITGMTAEGGLVRSVQVEVGGETVVIHPQSVVSSTPAEFLAQFLLPERSQADPNRPRPAVRKRVVVLAYLFIDEEPRFPHFWLQVTCPKMKAGRIANYAALNADLVPPGKTCLCLEYYCFDDDPMIDLSSKEVSELALREAATAGLVDRAKCFDTLVLKFPGADASQNRHNWLSPARQQLLSELRQFVNLYSVNRTDLDIATLAGIEAAEAILAGDRAVFDRHFDPRELGIRSESKPFEFKTPAGVQI